jgi:Flp pilus assembly protein TadB
MKLNDPFGRMARRHQTGYESMRAILQNANVTTPEAAREVMRNTRIRAVKFLVVCIFLLLLAAWLLPDSFIVAVFFGCLVIAWVLTWTINGQRYVQRYIDEDLEAGSPGNNSDS